MSRKTVTPGRVLATIVVTSAAAFVFWYLLSFWIAFFNA